MKNSTVLLLAVFAISCTKKEKVDSIVINANVYTVNSNFDTAEAFAIKEGKIIDIGTTLEIQTKYASTNINDVKGKTVVPGFIDAHCHFYGLGLQQQKVELSGTNSFEEVVQRIVGFQK